MPEPARSYRKRSRLPTDDGGGRPLVVMGMRGPLRGLYLRLLAAAAAAALLGRAQIAQAQPSCDVDFNGAGGGAFTQPLCESPTFGGGLGFMLKTTLPSGACGEGCAATTSEQADIDACAAIALTGTDYTGDAGTDRRVECEGTAAPCQYTPPTTCTAATCCDGATSSPRAPAHHLAPLMHSPPIGLRRRGASSDATSSHTAGVALQTSTAARVPRVPAWGPRARTQWHLQSGTRVRAMPATSAQMKSTAMVRGVRRARLS